MLLYFQLAVVNESSEIGLWCFLLNGGLTDHMWWCLVSEEQVPKVPQRTSSQSYRLSSATAAMDSSHDPDGTLSNRKVSTDTASGADVSQVMPVGQVMLKWSVLFDDVKGWMLSFEDFFYSVCVSSVRVCPSNGKLCIWMFLLLIIRFSVIPSH